MSSDPKPLIGTHPLASKRNHNSPLWRKLSAGRADCRNGEYNLAKDVYSIVVAAIYSGLSMMAGTAITVVTFLFAITLLSGCASPRNNTPGDVQANTQLALSPNGNRLLVSWHDRNDKLHAKLVELKDGEVASIRKIELPQNTFTTAFANNNQQIIFTTKEGASSSLLEMDLEKSTQKLIYKSQFIMRFPLEVSSDNYVFLEGVDAESRVNRWHRYQNGKKSLLNTKGYGSAAPLSVMGDALFILEPWNPPAFRNINGALPDGLTSLIDRNTFNIVCAGRTALTCLKDSLYKDVDGASFIGIMELIGDSQRCEVDGRWKDAREIRISRDGNVVVFHAALGEWDGPRAIYVIINANGSCPANSISIKGE